MDTKYHDIYPLNKLDQLEQYEGKINIHMEMTFPT